MTRNSRSCRISHERNNNAYKGKNRKGSQKLIISTNNSVSSIPHISLRINQTNKSENASNQRSILSPEIDDEIIAFF